MKLETVQQETAKLLETSPLESMPHVNDMVTLAVIAAVSAYGITWFARAALGVRGGRWGWKLRLIALISGGCTGYILGGYPWGMILGICGGGLVTAIIAAVKKRIKSAA